MLRNKIGPVFNARNGSFFLFFCFLKKHPLLSAGRMRFLKTKKTKQKKMDQFLTLEKAKIGPVFNSTAYIYISYFFLSTVFVLFLLFFVLLIILLLINYYYSYSY